MRFLTENCPQTTVILQFLNIGSWQTRIWRSDDPFLSKVVVGIANTITRAVLTLGMKLAMEYNQMERGVGLVRALGQGSTDYFHLDPC